LPRILSRVDGNHPGFPLNCSLEPEIMEDFIAIFVLAIECGMAALVTHYAGAEIPALAWVVVFLVLAFVGLGVWQRRDVDGWRKVAVSSVGLGVLFFGGDVFLAHLDGQRTFQFRGGPLGLPLTFVTWCCTMVSTAGFARAHYVKASPTIDSLRFLGAGGPDVSS